ncbi:MAG: hypothetical protein RIS64_1991 [Bacteroidota bacterium]
MTAKNTIHIIGFAWFVFFAAMPLLAQNLTGVLRDGSDSKPLAYAIVLLLKTDKSSIEQYIYTDSLGKFSFKQPAQGWIKGSFIGYQDTFMQIMPDKHFYEMVLMPKSLMIQTVEIREKSMAIVVQGDTIRYNLDRFRNGTEDNLGELMDKLPGMEIRDGIIYYEGKKVQKLLVEAKDILWDKHQLMTQGIKASDVKQVKVIKQYKDAVDQLTLSTSDKVAVDLELTEQAKAKFNGFVNAGAGYLERYNAELKGFRVQKKVGFGIFVNANNTGQELLSAGEYMKLQTNMSKTFEQAMGNQTMMSDKDLLPKALQPMIFGNKIGSQSIASTFDWTPDAKLHSKTGILWVNSDRSAGNAVLRTYSDSLRTQIAGQQNVQNAAQILQLQHLTEKWFAKGYLWRFELPLHWEKNADNTQFTGIFNHLLQQSNYQFRKKTWDVSPSFSIGYKDSIHFAWNLTVGLRHFDEQSQHFVQDITPVLNTNATNVHQNIANRQQNVFAELKTTWQQTSWKLQNIVFSERKQLFFQAEMTDSDTLRQPFLAGQRAMQINTLSELLKLEYRYRNWQLELLGELRAVNRVGNGQQAEQNLVPLWKTKLQYNISNLNKGFISYQKTLNWFELPQLSDIATIRNANELTQYQIPFQQQAIQHKFNFFYQNIQLSKNLMWILSMAYVQNEAPIVMSTEVKSRYTLYTMRVAPQQRSVQLSNFWDKNWLDNKLSSSFQTNTTYNNDFTFIKGQFYPVQILNHSLNANLSYSQIKNRTLKIGSNWTYYGMKNDFLNQSQYHNRWTNYYQVAFHAKPWQFKHQLWHDYTISAQQKQSNIRIDAEMNYTFSKYPLKIFALGKNINQLGNVSMLNVDLNPNYFEIRQQNRLAGYILFGLEYKL